MAKQQWKPSAMLAPVPAAMVTCKDGDKINVLTIAWTGIINSKPPRTYISVRPERYSYDLIRNSGVFVINLTSRGLIRACDFVGVKSGRDIDKFETLALAHEPSPNFAVPMLCDSPVSVECKVFDRISLGSHDMFLADIVSVSVEEQFVEGGKLRLDKADVVGFAHGSYYALGKFLGNLGDSVMKKKTAARKRKK